MVTVDKKHVPANARGNVALLSVKISDEVSINAHVDKYLINTVSIIIDR